MKFPMKNRYLVFERQPDGSSLIYDHYSKRTWNVKNYEARLLSRLDGHHDPRTVSGGLEPEAVDRLMKKFAREGLLDHTNGRIISAGRGSFLFPLFRPAIRKGKGIGTAWNSFLLFSWLPILIMGISVFLSAGWHWKAGLSASGYADAFFGWLLGVFVGIILHEASHAAAALAYGGKFFEFGLALEFLLPGAYVLIEYDQIKNRFQRSQIAAAGIEANLFAAGCCFLLLAAEAVSSAALISAAIVNVMLAALNLSFLHGLDGSVLLQELLGSDDFVARAKKLIVSARGRDRLRVRLRGITGRMTLTACLIVSCYQVLLPLILILDVCWLLLQLI